jgi:hypothetical protein
MCEGSPSVTGLDPLSTLSVAAALVRFIDFSSQIVCKGSQLNKPTHGLHWQNERTETVTIHLKELTHGINISFSSAKRVQVSSQELRQQYTRLQEICKKCGIAGEKLLDRLRRLEVPKAADQGKWKSFRQALKTVWKKE